ERAPDRRELGLEPQLVEQDLNMRVRDERLGAATLEAVVVLGGQLVDSELRLTGREIDQLPAVAREGAAGHDDFAACKLEPLELGARSMRREERPLRDVREVRGVVRLAAVHGVRRLARRARRDKVPGAAEIEIERLEARREHDAVDVRLVVAVDAVAGV